MALTISLGHPPYRFAVLKRDCLKFCESTLVKRSCAMRIGCSISTSNGGSATLGCFVVKRIVKHKLYAIVSKHAFETVNSIVYSGNKRSVIGKVIQVTPNLPISQSHKELDAALVELSDEVARSLTQESLAINRGSTKIQLKNVFNPSPYRTRGPLSPTHTAMHLMVWHSGQISEQLAGAQLDTFAFNHQFGTISIADIAKERYRYAERHNRPGDSGGPVYQDDGTLIGFNGGGAGPELPTELGKGTAGGFYRLAYDVFSKFGVALATWENRDHWLPLPKPEPKVEEVGWQYPGGQKE